MARAGLGWGAKELAERAGVSYPTIHRFESGQSINQDSLRKVANCLVGAGANFTVKSGRRIVSVPE